MVSQLKSAVEINDIVERSIVDNGFDRKVKSSALISSNSDGIESLGSRTSQTIRKSKSTCQNHSRETSPESQQVTKRSMKSVSFNPIVRFKNVKHINDYSDREYFATWFVEDDLQIIFNHCVETVTKMVNGEILDENKGFCPRGLEYKTPTGARTRKESKTRALHAVLDEQERQRILGLNDPHRVARLYKEAGNDSRRTCRLLAIKDQEEARPILQSKCSILVTQEKTKKSSLLPNDRLSRQEEFNRSATSVVEEFALSVNHVREHGFSSDSIVESDLHRVRFAI